MATMLAVAVAILVVGTVLGLLRRSQHRIRDLEAELGEVYEAQHIIDQARRRKNRTHLHLLATLPLAWVAGRLQSPTARLAAATAASTMVAGASFVATDSRPPKQLTPPAAADTIPHTAPAVSDDDYSLSGLVPSTTTSSSSSVVEQPPAPTTDVEVEPAPLNAPTAPAPSTTTSTTSTTTTTVLDLLPDVEACVNPQGILLPDEVCLSG